MKKLISAASALAMAASMVGSAVPFAAGAADSSKTYELRAFVDKDGKEVSTTISADAIAAGDVIIPVGFYYVEQTNDTAGIRAQWTVNSEDGDASNTNISFNQWEPNSEYFNADRTVSWNGQDWDTNRILGFAGTLTKNRKGVSYVWVCPDTAIFSVDTKQDSSNCKNAFGSAVWTPRADGTYEYLGEKSDSYPVTVFEVVFKKGTPVGTYTLDFIDYADDPAAPENSTCQVEAAGGKMTKGNGKLNLKGMTITIGEGGAPASTTTTTTTSKPDTTTTTTTTGGGNQGNVTAPVVSGDVDDFVITGGKYNAKPGDTVEVEFAVSSAKHVVVLGQCELDYSDGLTVKMEDNFAYCAPSDVTYSELGPNKYSATFKDPKTSDAVALNDKDPIMILNVTVPASAKDGDVYNVGFKSYHIVEDAFKPIEFDAKVEYATITVGDGTVTPPDTGTTTTTTSTTTTSTTTTTTTTTTSSVTTTTTTKAPVGDTVYGDVNCDGKVNIADVVVLNKYLNDASSYNMTEQGKKNADCCKVGDGINAQDSDAIIKSIVHLVTLPYNG